MKPKRKYSSKLVCQACGVKWIDHMGLSVLCRDNAELKKENARLSDIIRRALAKCYRNSYYDVIAIEMCNVLKEIDTCKS